MTPLQKQYNQIKSQYPDTILFFRMGDFYEGFGDDAKTMAKVLGITLTSRSKEKNEPMAGVPHHALDAYLYKMVKAGYKVAICEQLEDPKKAKGIVKRGVVKVITPGTITDEKAVDITADNYILSLDFENDICGIAYADLNTGKFKTTEVAIHTSIGKRKIIDEISRLDPSEILLCEDQQQKLKTEFPQILDYYLQYVDDDYFELKEGQDRIEDFFDVQSLKGFGIENRELCISASGGLLKYLKETQKNSLTHLNPPSHYNLTDHMMLDAATMKNLELVYSLGTGSKRGSLLNVIDKTSTTMGARLLRSWVLQPLIEKDKIVERLNTVECFVEDPERNDQVRELLSEVYDLERLASKLGSATANPKDLVALKVSIQRIPHIAKYLPKPKKKSLLKPISDQLTTKEFEPLIKLLEDSLNPNAPALVNEGGIIRDGYNKELDEIRNAARGGKDWLKNLQKEEIEKTGITTLKVKFNKVFGYYIEVTKSHLDKVPEEYIRKQTLVNAERFITPELKEMEDKILGAQDRMIELEYKLFSEIRDQTAEYIRQIQSLAQSIAILDVLTNFAYIARYNNYTKPEINGEGLIEIKDGRHPVVEELSDEPFIPNDSELNKDTHQLVILTGPNMSGKSTYIRQVALITLMAQIGSFVPASAAKIGVTDRIFTRVGASDNLSQGESTFMVEMNETANILNNATEKSLIILDEVGRGTSTYDGVSIAWAIAEYIHNQIGACTLFATHYHELIKLEQILDRVHNVNVAVKEDDESVVFLRKIVDGGTDQSYGVYVAELAGVPKDVVQKAKEILAGLEQESMFQVGTPLQGTNEQETKPNKEVQPSFFTAPISDPRWEKIKEELEKIDINNMTPMEAMEKLDKIKKQTQE